MSTEGPLKVSARSNPNAVAGALAAALRERDAAELQAVGAGAINQAIKAIAIARNYLKGNDIDVICTPSFITVAISQTERTGLSLIVENRNTAAESRNTAAESCNTVILSEASRSDAQSKDRRDEAPHEG